MGKGKFGWNLSAKWTLAYSALILLISGTMAFSLYFQMRTTQRQAFRERLQDIVSFAAPQVDGDYHSLIRTSVDDSNSFYRVVSLRLKSIQATSEIIDRIYTLREQPDGRLTFVVDTSPEEPATVGQAYTRPSALLANGLSAITAPVVEENLYEDAGSYYLSGYAPIYDQFGDQDGVIGIDIDATAVIENEANARRIALLAFFFMIPLSLLLGWWLAGFLTAPINELVKGARRVAQGNLAETVPIHRQDELGILANAFNQMTVQLRQTLTGLEREIAEHKRTAKIQDCIYKISQAVNSTASLDEFYATIHAILGELLPVENFYIALYEPAEDLIVFPYYVDQRDKDPDPIQGGAGMTGYIMRTGKSLLATPEMIQNLVEQNEIELIGAESIDWLGVPLKVEGHIIGAVVVQSYSEEIRFDQDDLNLIEFVSSQVALAIDHKQSAEALHQSNERYRGLFEDSPISLWEEDFSAVKKILEAIKMNGVTDIRGFLEAHPEVVAECASLVVVLDVNKATLDLFGARSKEEMLSSLALVFCDESYPFFLNELVNIANGCTKFDWDGVNQTLDGRRIDVNINWCVVPGHEEDLSKVIVSMLDITERQKAEKELKHMSTHDALTGLYNRAFFDEEMARLERERMNLVSIIMADMDDLKAVNDRYGHAAGDELLRRAAKVLRDSFRGEDIVARIGGDEFAVLLPNISMQAANMAIVRIQNNIKEQNEAKTDLPLSISLGVSTIKEGQTLSDGLRQADENMYLVKHKKG